MEKPNENENYLFENQFQKVFSVFFEFNDKQKQREGKERYSFLQFEGNFVVYNLRNSKETLN